MDSGYFSRNPVFVESRPEPGGSFFFKPGCSNRLPFNHIPEEINHAGSGCLIIFD